MNDPPDDTQQAPAVDETATPEAPAGMFGRYGGRACDARLLPALDELARVWPRLAGDERFLADVQQLARDHGGRPTALHAAEGLTGLVRAAAPPSLGAEVWLKREDVAGAMGPAAPMIAGLALLTRFLRRPGVFATSVYPRHAVAVAMAAAHFDVRCDIAVTASTSAAVEAAAFAGARLVERPDGEDESVSWAETAPERVWIPRGAVGPHPMPSIVRDLRAASGRELRAQCLRWIGRLPSAVIASASGGRECIGLIAPFLRDPGVRIEVVCDDRLRNRVGGEPMEIGGALSPTPLGPVHAHLAATSRVAFHAVEQRAAAQAALAAAREDGVIGGPGLGEVLDLALAVARDLPRDAVVVACVPPEDGEPLTAMAARFGLYPPAPRTSSPVPEGGAPPKRKRRKRRQTEEGQDAPMRGAPDHEDE